MSTDTDIRGAVHTNVRHDSGHGHVTGKARYIDDMPVLPGTVEIVLVTSPHAHAAIKSIDVAAALAADGVRGVLTADDIPGHNDIGPIFEGEPVLAAGVADYAGAPIVAVAADSFDQAFAAAGQVEIEYEVLPAVLEIEDALEQELYTYPPQIMTYGDPDSALDGAARRIKGELRCGGQDHFYLESNIALAVPRDDGDLDVHSSTQHPSEVQHGVAHVLGMPTNAITVEVRRMGGGFGGKESQPTIIAAIAGLVANHTGLPAKLRLRRDDDMIVTGKRHDFLFRYDVGFDDDGRISGVDILMGMRSGNVADLSPGVLARALCHADNCYYLPNARLSGYPCKTNTVSNTAFRGFGGPQGMIVIEAILEHIARENGQTLDHVRAVNYYGTEDRNVTPYEQTVKDNIIVPLVERLQSEVDFDGMSRAADEFNASHETLKKGVALMPVKFGISFNTPKLNQAGALVHVYADGSVHLNHGGTEMGQGLFTKVAQVVASVFQIDLDNIKISATRTDKVPNTSATAASSGSDLNGMAAFNAATAIKGRMAQVAADHFDTDVDAIEFRQNRVYAGNESLSFSELAEETYNQRVQLSEAGFYSTPGLHWNAKKLVGNPFYYFTYGAAIAEVLIDTLTGESRVLRADILQDCGSSLNPAIDIGQIEGAFVQGQGWLTSEELVWNDRGQLLTHGPSTYKIPGSRDVPPVFNVHLLEDAPNRVPTVFHSKAVGEPPLMLAISVWLAIRDAVSRIGDNRLVPKLDAPATPEAILAAVEDIQARSGA
ncbi:MAG: xanthine dehydrogenase molybdopterin binding subunit [Alphaproteobacteria bacterium]|nr:xanthine dehydrogenase molybdopterin binding subunit [Alphaproteobacteria bacterium]